MESNFGTLWVVATPIGNLEDITFRAIRILGEVDEILCEDTRTSRILLQHYSIKTPTSSFHAFSDEKRIQNILFHLKNGKSYALISDAGTPGISDPGFVLIRAAIDAGIQIIPIPGASALITALCVSGLDTHQFLYIGFPPQKKGRKTLFQNLSESPYTGVLYESVHRIEKTLSELLCACGEKRRIVIGRELTKKFEEFFRGSLQEALIWAQEKHPKGEFVLILSPKRKEREEEGEGEIID